MLQAERDKRDDGAGGSKALLRKLHRLTNDSSVPFRAVTEAVGKRTTALKESGCH